MTMRTSPLKKKKIAVHSPLLPGASICRLHGAPLTPIHLASFHGLSATPSSKSKQPAATSSILFCTSTLPLVRVVIQYDLPTKGGATGYVRRVGWTALAGKDSEARSIVAPSESEWLKWVEGKMRGEMTGEYPDDDKFNITLEGTIIEGILAKDFGGNGT
ncbi:hypothetical protein DFH29DRAFT_930702, partial [Suillus ampliporus]